MSIEIRKGTPEDTEPMLRFLREVWETMAHKEWFFLSPAEEIREMMASGAMELWTAMDGSRLAGVFTIVRPGLGRDNYGYDLGLTEGELLRVVNMDTAAVHPDYRGQGLQKRLMEFAESQIAGEGAHILLCTVHPENRFSLENVLNQGYTIQKKLEKYGSERYVLRKDVGMNCQSRGKCGKLENNY